MADSLNATPVVTGSVINPSAFAKGGMLFLGAFKPGRGAAADAETDEASSMIVKGISDVLPAVNTSFIVSTDPEQQPEYLLEGHIEEYGRPKSSSGPKLRKDQVVLSVNGEIWIWKTGEKICSFQTSVTLDRKKDDPRVIAYQIGVAISHFIRSKQ